MKKICLNAAEHQYIQIMEFAVIARKVADDMKDLYTNEYAKLTLKILWDNIEDLSMWSAYNEDAGVYEINDIVKSLEKLKKTI